MRADLRALATLVCCLYALSQTRKMHNMHCIQAIVLFEMLCGFTPFADSADMDETFIYERILHEDMSIHIECVEGDEELDLMTQVRCLVA